MRAFREIFEDLPIIAWWRLYRVLSREEIRCRYNTPAQLNDRDRKWAGRYLAVTDPPILAALIGAVALILTTAALIHWK